MEDHYERRYDRLKADMVRFQEEELAPQAVLRSQTAFTIWKTGSTFPTNTGINRCLSRKEVKKLFSRNPAFLW